jgi:hypothetical protein
LFSDKTGSQRIFFGAIPVAGGLHIVSSAHWLPTVLCVCISPLQKSKYPPCYGRVASPTYKTILISVFLSTHGNPRMLVNPGVVDGYASGQNFALSRGIGYIFYSKSTRLSSTRASTVQSLPLHTHLSPSSLCPPVIHDAAIALLLESGAQPCVLRFLRQLA